MMNAAGAGGVSNNTPHTMANFGYNNGMGVQGMNVGNNMGNNMGYGLGNGHENNF